MQKMRALSREGFTNQVFNNLHLVRWFALVMVVAFDAAWDLLKAVYGPITEKEAVDEHYRQNRPKTPYMSSFTNKDGKPTKRRFPGTPAWDKSRSIMDEYNLTGAKRTPMGTEGSMSDEDAAFLDMFNEEGDQQLEPTQTEAQKHGLTEEQYNDWQERMDSIMARYRNAQAN